MKSVPTKKRTIIGAALFAAAMAMPSSHTAFAEAAPEKGSVAFKYLHYQDSQPSQDRIGVDAYTVTAMAPIAGKWSISTTYVNDSVSGASPDYHTHILSGASSHDTREEVDLGLTRYFSKGSLTLGTVYSTENDYISRGYSGQGSLQTEDKNTTFTLGGSYTTDTINPTAQGLQYDKRTIAGLFGVTKVLSKVDILQLNFGISRGRGYFSDPYKSYDSRPDRRESKTIMTRWNHHFDGTDGTTRLSYRYYYDTFGIKASTLGLEYVQPLPNDFTVIPSVRVHSQTAADFYRTVYPPVPRTITPNSLDQRLSAFGALTLGIKVEKRIAKDWLVDVKYENYEQRAGWCVTGGGDNNLAPFTATFLQLGVSRLF